MDSHAKTQRFDPKASLVATRCKMLFSVAAAVIQCARGAGKVQV